MSSARPIDDWRISRVDLEGPRVRITKTLIQPNCLMEALTHVQDEKAVSLLGYIQDMDQYPDLPEKIQESLIDSKFYQVFNELNIAYEPSPVNLFRRLYNRQSTPQSPEAMKKPLLETIRELCRASPEITIAAMIQKLRDQPGKERSPGEQKLLNFLDTSWIDDEKPENAETVKETTKNRIHGKSQISGSCPSIKFSAGYLFLGALALLASGGDCASVSSVSSVSRAKRFVDTPFARFGDYPWIVKLNQVDSSGDESGCSGFLVDESSVVTAAHCVRELVNKGANPDEQIQPLNDGVEVEVKFKNARVTETSRASTESRVFNDIPCAALADGENKRKAFRYIKHPNYNESVHHLLNDVAILKIHPINDQALGIKFPVIDGDIYTSNNATKVKNLKAGGYSHGDLQVASPSWETSSNFFIYNGQYTTKDPRNDPGDSGGPVFYTKDNENYLISLNGGRAPAANGEMTLSWGWPIARPDILNFITEHTDVTTVTDVAGSARRIRDEASGVLKHDPAGRKCALSCFNRVADRQFVRMARWPSPWIGGTVTLSVGGRTGSFDVWIIADGTRWSTDLLQGLCRDDSFLTDAAQSIFQRLDNEWTYQTAIRQALKPHKWFNPAGSETGEFRNVSSLTVNASYQSPYPAEMFLVLNEQADSADKSLGYARTAIKAGFAANDNTLHYELIDRLYSPHSPPRDVLNCFPDIALVPFDNIPGLSGWLVGDLTLTVGGRTGNYTVLMKNDGSGLGKKFQAFFSNDYQRLHAAARYLLARIEGSSQDIRKVQTSRAFNSIPLWMPEAERFGVNLARDYHGGDFHPERLYGQMDMYLILNESSSTYGVAAQMSNGDRRAHGRPALRVSFRHVQGGRGTNYVHYTLYKSLYINNGFNQNFHRTDNSYPAGWCQAVLNIPSAGIGKVPFTGHLSSSSDLKRVRITNSELINAASQSLLKFIHHGYPMDTSNIIDIPEFNELSVSIRENNSSMAFEPGGELDRVILYAGDNVLPPSDIDLYIEKHFGIKIPPTVLPAAIFGQEMPVAVISMDSSIYDDSVSITFYRKLTIDTPSEFSGTVDRLSCPDNFFPRGDGWAVGTIELNHALIGSIISDAEILATDATALEEFLSPEVQFLMSSLLRRSSRVGDESASQVFPDDSTIMAAYEKEFGRETNLQINGTVVHSEDIFTSSAYPDGNQLRLWLFRRDILGHEKGIPDENNPQISVSILKDEQTGLRTLNYRHYMPQNIPEGAELLPENDWNDSVDFFTDDALWPDDWSKGMLRYWSSSGHEVFFEVRMSAPSDEVKGILGSEAMMKYASRALQGVIKEGWSVMDVFYDPYVSNFRKSSLIQSGGVFFMQERRIKNNQLILLMSLEKRKSWFLDVPGILIQLTTPASRMEMEVTVFRSMLLLND